MPIGCYTPMACQPLPLGFKNLEIQIPRLQIISLHIKQHFLDGNTHFKRNYLS
jgi:hypothetical protein